MHRFARSLSITLAPLALLTGVHQAAAADDLASFGVLAGSTVTNTGATVISGNVGVSPGSAITGFPPGIVVDGKYRNPAWAPPDEVKRAEPWLPDYIPGGSPRNPMGMRALTLSGGEYAIHGTNRPDSIGTAASFGCIRMYNRDIVDLFERVEIGTPVVMMP